MTGEPRAQADIGIPRCARNDKVQNLSKLPTKAADPLCEARDGREDLPAIGPDPGGLRSATVVAYDECAVAVRSNRYVNGEA